VPDVRLEALRTRLSQDRWPKGTVIRRGAPWCDPANPAYLVLFEDTVVGDGSITTAYGGIHVRIDDAWERVGTLVVHPGSVFVDKLTRRNVRVVSMAGRKLGMESIGSQTWRPRYDVDIAVFVKGYTDVSGNPLDSEA